MEELFKGYVLTNNKTSTMKFKNVTDENLLTLENAQQYSEYAGILAEDTILIDVDDEEQSEILMNIIDNQNIYCRSYKTTRGRHFLMLDKQHKVKKNHINIKLACGITADIKIGTKPTYAVLKYNDQERVIDYDIDESWNYDNIPSFLLPTAYKDTFFKMGEGDGRNDALFNYKVYLIRQRYAQKDIKQILDIINTFIFKDPLNPTEFTKICRTFRGNNEDFDQEGGAFRHDTFAENMMSHESFIKIFNTIYVYYQGCYTMNRNFIDNIMTQYRRQITTTQRNEVYNYMNIRILEDKKRESAQYISFLNGMYDLENNVLLDHDNSKIITNLIPHCYNADAYNVTVDNVLNNISCHDVQIRMLLEEVIGYTFFTWNELRKAFILKGDKHNGKSTYLTMIKGLLGRRNYSSLDLKELNDRFKTEQLEGVLANIGDDIEDDYIKDVATLKKLISGDTVTAERKGEKAFQFDCTAKFLFSANSIPKMNDKTGAVMDRFVIVPFNADFTKDTQNFDPYIKYKLQEQSAYEYMINIGIKGLKRVLLNQSFTTSSKIKKEMHEYNMQNNPTLQFFEVYKNILGKNTNEVYNAYKLFCESGGYQATSKINFGRQVKRYYHVEKIRRMENGKTLEIYVDETTI